MTNLERIVSAKVLDGFRDGRTGSKQFLLETIYSFYPSNPHCFMLFLAVMYLMEWINRFNKVVWSVFPSRETVASFFIHSICKIENFFSNITEYL